MVVNSRVHLERRDRHAFRFRLSGAVVGAAVVVAAFATSSWDSPWVIGAFVLVTCGGAVAYYLLTSIVRCPSCNARLANFRIASDDERQKTFACGRCGAAAYLREGFYWQSDTAG
jgi:uncharacterized protein YbaR (Trm112 family)